MGGSVAPWAVLVQSPLYWLLRPDYVHALASVETYPFAASASASVQM